MFPKNRRIPREMFPLLSNGTKIFKNNLFLLRFVFKKRSSRFCFSVSKKIAKSAVVRNRLRRSGYRLLRPYLPQIKSNILAIFSFRDIPADDRVTSKNLSALLKESKLIK